MDFQIGDCVVVTSAKRGTFWGEVVGKTITTVDVFDRVSMTTHMNVPNAEVEKFVSRSQAKRVAIQRGSQKGEK